MSRDRRTGSRRPSFAWGLAALGVALSLSACAPKQTVPIEVLPNRARLYLDGEMLAATPTSVELRADRDHKLFFKEDGYRSQLVVLRTVLGPEGEERLDPPVVRVELVPIDRSGREVEIEAEAR